METLSADISRPPPIWYLSKMFCTRLCSPSTCYLPPLREVVVTEAHNWKAKERQ